MDNTAAATIVTDDDHQQEALQEPLLLIQRGQEDTNNNNNDNNNDGISTRSTSTSAAAASAISSSSNKNRNIPVMLWFQFLRCGAEAIWLSSVLSAYVYLIRPNNPEMVGYLSAVEGITQFVAACVAGVLADTYRRDTLLKLSSLIGVTASVLIILSTTMNIFPFLVMALMLNGAFDGIGLTASLALYADSITTGDRSYYFTQRTLATNLGQVLGPLVALIMFYCMGDHWSIPSTAYVMVTAQILLVPAFVLLWFFRDVSIMESTTTATGNNNERGDNDENDEEENATTTEPLLENEECPLPDDDDDEVEEEQQQDTEQNNDDIFLCGMSKARFIAICCAISDVTCAFASGVSFRYFAIFFLKDLYFGPVLVQVLDALSCLVGSGLLVVAQKLSLPLGRCPVSVAFKTVGVALLLGMIFVYKSLHHNHSDDDHHHDHRWCITLIGSFYVLQNAFLNSTGALTRSLIMDHVPAKERAKWSALESINIFGWCGSAAIGGIIVKHFGGNVVPVFYFTVAFQVVGSLPLVALFGVEGKEQQQQHQQEGEQEEG